MKKLSLLFVFCVSLLTSFGQDESFGQRFTEANTLIEEGFYNVALPIWLELGIEKPDNANVNYKIGLCYINSANEKKKSLPYLEKAITNTTTNYDPFSSAEKKAPVEAYFYLARAQHVNLQIDEAIANYTAFKEKISKKHFLFKDIDHHIQQCNNAKEAIANPVNIVLNNMKTPINSEYPDYGPVLSLDESIIYFTSRRLRSDSSNYYIKDGDDGMYFEDIYVSYNIDGDWSEPELLSFNTEGHEATINLSIDGQTLFIFKDDNGNGNLYSSNLIDDEWTAPNLLGSDINTEAHETHVTISPDGSLLYFVSDRKGGLGGQDIYFCKKLPNGEWARAQNMGNAINTPYDEDGVFIHPDGKTIYFSSKGHKSIGGFDVFSSEYDEESQSWSTPVNLGYPVNSTDDDVFFVTSADGKRGYYSSFKEIGKGKQDIYMISMTDAEEKPLTLLTGFIKVVGYDKLPDDAQIIITDKSTGDMAGIFKPRNKDGKFSIILEPDVDYHIVYSAAGYEQEEDLYIPPMAAFNEINRGIELKEIVFGGDKDPITYLHGVLEYKKLMASGTKVSILDENDKVIGTTVTNEAGEFKFTNLTPDNYYFLRIDDVHDEDFINEAKAYVLNSKGEKVLMAIKKGDNKRAVRYLPTKDLDKLPLIEEKDDSEIEVIDPKVNDLRILASYQQFFNYNIKAIDEKDLKFKDLINQIASKVGNNEKAYVIIEASSSRVPTKTFGNNKKLSKARAKAAGDIIKSELKKKSVNLDNVIFTGQKTLVQGPKYKGDYKNTANYEKYQYVTISVK